MRFYYRKSDGRTNEHGQVVYMTPGGFATLARIDGVVCVDGVRRNATIYGYPDSFFSIPAQVSVKGKTVTGWVGCENGEYYFRANSTGKYANLIETCLCQCKARYCDCHTKKYKSAVVSILATRKELCAHCAPKGDGLGLYAGGCEESEKRSDAQYGAQIGLTGNEYREMISRSYRND